MNIDLSTNNTSHQQTVPSLNPLNAIGKASPRTRRTLVNRVSIFNEMGVSAYQSGDFETSEKCFAQGASQLGIDSQSSTKTMSSVDNDVRMVNSNQYDEGMHMYNTPLKLSRFQEQEEHQQQDVPQHIAAAVVSFNMAQVLIKCKKMSLSKYWLHQARCWAKSNNRTSKILMVKILHSLGYCNYVSGKGDMGMEYYQQALGVCQRSTLGNQYIASSLNCVGVLQFCMDDPSTVDKSLVSFEQCLQLYQSCHGLVDPLTIATVHNNIGRLHFLRSDFNKALESFQQSLDVRRSLLGDGSVDVAATLYNTAQAYQQLGQLEESLKHYKAFLDTAKSIFGEDSKDVALSLKRVAEIHQEKGNHDTALDFFHQALRAQTAADGRLNLDVAALLNKIGNIYYELKDFESSMAAYSEGLNIECAILPPNHPHIIVTQTNIAHVHKQLDEYPEALEAYEQVLNMQVEAFGSDSVVLAETATFIGLMQYNLEDFPSALESYKFALRLHRQHLAHNDDHPSIASTLNSIGLIFFKQKAYDLANLCFTESLRIRTKLLGPDHRGVAILWYNLATVYFEIGDQETAIKMYKETLRVEKLHLGENHPDVVLTLMHLGQVYQQLGHFEEAINYYQQVLLLERKRASPDCTALYKALNLLGNAYLQLNQVPEMMACYVAASRLNTLSNESAQLIISGFNFYALTKTNPPAAPAA